MKRDYLYYQAKWVFRHAEDSYIMFWSAGLICFILGIYQLGASIVVYNQFIIEKSPDNNEVPNNS